MQTIKRELIIRKEEVESIIRFITSIENERLFTLSESEYITFSAGVSSISIKASIILMMYNAVESTITKCLKRIHEKLKNENLKYDELNISIKKLLIVYYEYAMNKSENPHNSVDYVMELIDFIKGSAIFTLSYEKLSKFYSLYSGNLDSKAIISILSKYGIPFNDKLSELQTIKNNRNKLAHGECSFEEIGRTLSIQQLDKMKDKTFDYLEKVIDVITVFIDSKKYLVDIT